MLGQAAIEFLSLGVSQWQAVGIIYDAIPNSFNELKPFLNTEAQNVCEL